MTDEPVELPDEYGYWTRPATGPSWSTAEVAHIFYGVDYDDLAHWLGQSQIWVDLDGRPVEWDTFPGRSTRWRLYDIERGAHVLTTAGKMSPIRLARAVGIVKLIAQQHGVAVSFEPLKMRKRDRQALRRHVRSPRPTALLRDAVTGENGAIPRHFALAGNEYEIDLVDRHWAQVLQALSTVLARARILRPAPLTYHAIRSERAAITAWARANGMRVSDRGIMPRKILDAYRAAMEED